MSEATIGSSMLEYLLKQSEPEINNDVPPRSILHSLVPEVAGRIIVKGPHATNIAMDMSHEIASQCRCNAAPCRCVAVDFLTLRSSSESASSAFPLFCQEKPEDDSEEDVQVKLRNLENSNPTWNQRALKRIRVQHFRSSRDLIAYLLKLHAQDRRPWGAIVVDGVERFVKHENSNCSSNSLSPEETMQVTQLLAILAGTGETLQKMVGAESLRVVATMQSSLTPNVERIVGNWFPNVVTMEQLKSTPAPAIPMVDKIQSSWAIKLGQDDINSKWGFSVVEKQSDGANVIMWGQQES